MKKIILLLIFGVLFIDSFCQFTGTFKKVRTDTIAGFNDTIWISDEAGSIAYMFTRNDSLFFGDITGTRSINSFDTIHFENGGWIYNTGSSIHLSVTGSEHLQLIEDVGNYSGIGTNNFGGLQFYNYNSDIMASFKNDSTRNDADTSFTWSAKAIRDYVSANGGEVSISGTPAITYIARWTDAKTITGSSGLNYTGGVLKNEYNSGEPTIRLRNTGGTNADIKLSSYGGVGDWMALYGPDIIRLGGSTSHGWIEVTADSASIGRDLHVYDSVYLDYIGGGEIGTGGAWAYLTPTNAIDSGSFGGGSKFGYEVILPNSIEEFLNDKENGEARWYFKDSKGNIIYEYSTNTSNPQQAMEKLFSGIEIRDRYILQNEQKIKKLENEVWNLKYQQQNLIIDFENYKIHIKKILKYSSMMIISILLLVLFIIKIKK